MTYTEKVGLRRPTRNILNNNTTYHHGSRKVWGDTGWVDTSLWDPVANARAAAEYWNKTFARRTREAWMHYAEEKTRQRMDLETRAGFEQMRDELGQS